MSRKKSQPKRSTLWSLIVLIALVVYYAVQQTGSASQKSNAPVPSNVELPAQRPEDVLVLSHTGYTLSFNTSTNCPNWVAWELTDEEVAGAAATRSNDFRGDPDVPAAHRVETTDYRATGYDRGHMCPAADMKWSAEAMSECFYMTNICPQVPVLNQKWWEHVETACRRWASREGRIFICCGPLYDPEVKARYIGRNVQVRVPDGFFKVVLSLQAGQEKAIAFLYRNTDERQTMDDAATTVDEVERLTGMDFFATLSDELESTLESTYDLRQWQ